MNEQKETFREQIISVFFKLSENKKDKYVILITYQTNNPDTKLTRIQEKIIIVNLMNIGAKILYKISQLNIAK